MKTADTAGAEGFAVSPDPENEDGRGFAPDSPAGKKAHRRKPPCGDCPYTLGLVHTLRNPCPECKLNGYQMYDMFKRQVR